MSSFRSLSGFKILPTRESTKRQVLTCTSDCGKEPTEAQLKELKAADMPVICEQNALGLAHRNDPAIVGWMHDDEPDNAQPVKGSGYGKGKRLGPCIPPSKIVDEYQLDARQGRKLGP